MARPEKRHVDYFPHYSSGKKMRYLRKKYGNDAYAVWFILLEQLAQAEDHHLELNEFNTVLMADETMVSGAVLTAIIEDLVALNEFDPALWRKRKVLYSGKFVGSVADAYRKRQNRCITAEEVYVKYGLKTQSGAGKAVSGGAAAENSAGNPQIKLKESKVKETKENLSVCVPRAREDSDPEVAGSKNGCPPQPEEKETAAAARKDTPDWTEVALEMADYFENHPAGKNQWALMAEVAHFSASPLVITTIWAGKHQDSVHLLRNWRQHTGKLVTWMMNVRRSNKVNSSKLKSLKNGSTSDHLVTPEQLERVFRQLEAEGY